MLLLERIIDALAVRSSRHCSCRATYPAEDGSRELCALSWPKVNTHGGRNVAMERVLAKEEAASAFIFASRENRWFSPCYVISSQHSCGGCDWWVTEVTTFFLLDESVRVPPLYDPSGEVLHLLNSLWDWWSNAACRTVQLISSVNFDCDVIVGIWTLIDAAWMKQARLVFDSV